MLLVDESADLAYTFVWLNEALSHLSLLSEGRVSTMMDGVPSADCLRPAPPAADMETIATQGCSGMPGRFEWQT